MAGIASSNQWKESSGADIPAARVITHLDHAGFVTFADSGAVSAYMVDDAAHAGYTTPDDSVSVGDSAVLIIGGVFATPI